MKLFEIFKRLGYPKHSDVIYDTLCKSKEPLLVSDLAKRSGLARMTIYRCLVALEKQKLVVRQVTGRRVHYAPGSPHTLQEAMRTLDTQSESVLSTYIQAREKDVPQSVRFLHGPAGIRAAFDDVISHTPKGDTFFRYTSERDLAKVNKYLARDYRERRDKKKLERLVISNAVSGSQKKSRLERFVKFIPRDTDQFEQNIIQLIYGECVSIIDLTTEEVVIIENKQLTDFQKVVFKLLYKQLGR